MTSQIPCSLSTLNKPSLDLLDYVQNPEIFDVKDGFMDLFTKSGLGVEINEEILKEGQKIGHN
jgi:galactonate dehydratase